MAKKAEYKCVDGIWKSSFYCEGQQYHTKAYMLYTHMLSRCKEGSKYQRDFPSYIGCKSLFRDFQDFAQWATEQKGYGKDGWHLDKDLLAKGNKLYSRETCCFIPSQINAFLTKRKANRGEYPIGVCAARKKFQAQMNRHGKLVSLGFFNTVDEAFLAYKIAKENLARELAESFRGQLSAEAYDALCRYAVDKQD